MRPIKRTLPLHRKKKNPVVQNCIRWGLYIVCIFLAFLFSTSGSFLKPILLLPILLSICSVSRPVTAALVGIVGGFLMDMTGGTLLGYHAIFLFLIGMATAVLYDRFFQQRFWNLLFFTAVTSLLVTGLDFLFQYGIWGYENLSVLYVRYTLPCAGYTTLSSIAIYPIFYLIHKYFLPIRKRTIEKKLKPMEETET